MEIIGITTHNLKNLNFKAESKEIIGVCGISGGGKASFAYSTIYKLCHETFSSIENGSCDSIEYKVSDFSNIVPSVSIKQNNFNTNSKSTIYSYLNFSSILSALFKEIPYDLLKLNKPLNECKACQGNGYIQRPDYSLLIDFDTPLRDVPFAPWKTKIYGNNKYEILFIEYCNSINVDIKKTFKELSDKEKQLLMQGISSKTFNFKFKHNKKIRTAKMQYVGMSRYLEDLLKSNKISNYNLGLKFSSPVKCSECDGARIDKIRYSDVKIYGINFVDFLKKPIDEILIRIKDKFLNNKLYNILKSISTLGIGYLNLSRSIPGLSGGELQKLRFSNLVNTNISNILIVLDEISSGVHWSDFDNFIKFISHLKEQNNIVLLIEHNSYFLSKCDRLICIGPGAGEQGGNIIDFDLDTRYKRSMQIKETKNKINFIEIKNININNIKNEVIKFPESQITCIVGKSGSGKTSLSIFLEQNIDNVIYISQKALRGNIKSNLATYTKINKVIADIFAKEHNLSYKDFMPNEDSDLVCKKCNGNGLIKYERAFENDTIIICPECNGMLFNNLANKYKINNYTISDVYDTEISFLNNSIKNPKIQKIGEISKNLSLAHLKLNRKIQTLSGGEAKRIRLLNCLLNNNITNKIIIIDELGSGLDNKTCIDIMFFLNSIKNKTKAILIVDHNPNVFLNSDYIIEMGPQSGPNGGKIIFNNNVLEYLKNTDFTPINICN